MKDVAGYGDDAHKRHIITPRHKQKEAHALTGMRLLRIMETND